MLMDVSQALCTCIAVWGTQVDYEGPPVLWLFDDSIISIVEHIIWI